MVHSMCITYPRFWHRCIFILGRKYSTVSEWWLVPTKGFVSAISELWPVHVENLHPIWAQPKPPTPSTPGTSNRHFPVTTAISRAVSFVFSFSKAENEIFPSFLQRYHQYQVHVCSQSCCEFCPFQFATTNPTPNRYPPIDHYFLFSLLFLHFLLRSLPFPSISTVLPCAANKKKISYQYSC